MKSNSRSGLFIALAMTFAGQSALATSIFGFELGAPLALDECDPHKSFVTRATCVWTRKSIPSPDNRQIMFGMADKPEIVLGPIQTFERDGRLLGVSFETYGLDNQQNVLHALEAKFGLPTSSANVVVQNLAGAHVDSIRARWARHGLTVEFQGTTDRIDRGFVEIMTSEGARIKKMEDVEKKPKRSL